MNTLFFTIMFTVVVVINTLWGLLLPGWVVIAAVFAYTVLATVEFKLDIKAKEAFRWVRNKYSSVR